MQKVGRMMSILMGICMGFGLSLTGTLTSGHFTLPGFLVSFAVSLVISLLIGFLVPMKPLQDRFCGGMPRGSLKRSLTEALISDLLYTPVITVTMVLIAYFQAKQHDAAPPFVPMLVKSLLISLTVGFVLAFVLMPLLLRLVMKRYGVQGGPPQGMPPRNGSGE